MSMYIWEGRETPLGAQGYLARRLVVESLEDGDGATRAHGFIEVMDYTEGHTWQVGHWWKAGYDAVSSEWFVDPAEEDPAWRKRDGGPEFTLDSGINAGIRRFIAERLAYAANVLEVTGASSLEEVLSVYNGPRMAYTGACMCSLLRRLHLKDYRGGEKFDWEACTAGGQFPANCFACSCGTRWYRLSQTELPQVWFVVTDEEAWNMLLDYNGVPKQMIDFNPESLAEEPTLVLLENNVKRGFVPIG